MGHAAAAGSQPQDPDAPAGRRNRARDDRQQTQAADKDARMLKGINPLMTPELLTALARMGHGATVAVHTQEARPYGCDLLTKGVLPTFGPEPAS